MRERGGWVGEDEAGGRKEERRVVWDEGRCRRRQRRRELVSVLLTIGHRKCIVPDIYLGSTVLGRGHC